MPSQHYQLFTAEAIGTFILCFLGNSVCANTLFKKSHGYKSGWIVISFGWGIALSMGIYASASKGHLNPAVSLVMFIRDQSEFKDGSLLILRFLGQMVGAFFGAVCCYLVYYEHFFDNNSQASQFQALILKQDHSDIAKPKVKVDNSNISLNVSNGEIRQQQALLNNKSNLNKSRISMFSQKVDHQMEDYINYIGIFSTFPSIRKVSSNLISEVLCTMMLVIMVLVLGDTANLISDPQTRKLYVYGLQPFLCGNLLTCIILCLGGATCACMNPFRDLMPRIAHQILPMYDKKRSEWEYSWIPVFGGFAGGLIGLGVYQLAYMSGIYDN